VGGARSSGLANANRAARFVRGPSASRRKMASCYSPSYNAIGWPVRSIRSAIAVPSAKAPIGLPSVEPAALIGKKLRFRQCPIIGIPLSSAEGWRKPPRWDTTNGLEDQSARELPNLEFEASVVLARPRCGFRVSSTDRILRASAAFPKGLWSNSGARPDTPCSSRTSGA
jgi:hypothetical protein